MSARRKAAGSGARRRSSRGATARGKAPSSRRLVYFFGGGRAAGSARMRERLGGKGANLAEMTRLGIPVPPGFTLTTDVLPQVLARGGRLPAEAREQALRALTRVEREMGARFGDARRPLLLSVRSGAPVSMPGMMDSILNLGLNEETLVGLSEASGERFALDSYRRLLQMYGSVVLGVPHERFEACLEDARELAGARSDSELSPTVLRGVADDYLELVVQETGKAFPQDPADQLWGAVLAVFRSWQNERAVRYRRLNGISEEIGTAVNVQAMVFGNMGDDCATGVAFTRDPNSGEKIFYGEYLKNAQGEDVVAGIRTPQPINAEGRVPGTASLPTLEEEMPGVYRELLRVARRLERHYRDMQDLEFTIQQGRLWLLQTRDGKRTPAAAVRIAVDLVHERKIRRDEAVCRVEPAQLDRLLHPTIDPAAPRNVLARGLPASPGAGVGALVFNSDVAEARVKAGERVVLVRQETSPNDIHGMHAAEAVLTARGGMTSHAAVVARGMGKPCVVGCGDLQIDESKQILRVGEQQLREGEDLTVDGGSGEVMLGRMPTVVPELGGAFSELLAWADRLRSMAVRTNVDTPQDAVLARDFGAEGIGLCRTEHMFFEPDRILAVQEMILASTSRERERALAKLQPVQRKDFVGIFQAMDGLPVTIRLLDPPLHEFLPSGDEGIRDLASALGAETAKVRAKVAALREFNPMLGHRGCRLGITFPEIYVMQVRAIAEAARDVAEQGMRVRPEIMVPLVAHAGELVRLRELVEREAAGLLRGSGIRLQVGSMIEVPRAALTADAIAEHADFFSFGTNDLTQMTYALSRDDTGKFLGSYLEAGILSADPFVSIDEAGVGSLMSVAVEKGRGARPGLKVGLCGEHAGDPASVRFCAKLGLDYVSCSPYRIPIARLAAAQAAVALQP